MSNYLFFDTETTGLPKNWKAPASDVNNWPRLVQLAWLQTDGKGKEIGKGNLIIKPEGFLIPADSAKVHRISQEIAEKNGIYLAEALDQFDKALAITKVIVAHNIDFDLKIMGAEYIRLNRKNGLLDKKEICTMKSSTDFCQITGKYGYKWPNLQELYQSLFGESFTGAHDAEKDVEITAKCYWELVNQAVL